LFVARGVRCSDVVDERFADILHSVSVGMSHREERLRHGKRPTNTAMPPPRPNPFVAAVAPSEEARLFNHAARYQDARASVGRNALLRSEPNLCARLLGGNACAAAGSSR
jgi:hypothetical protein